MHYLKNLFVLHDFFLCHLQFTFISTRCGHSFEVNGPQVPEFLNTWILVFNLKGWAQADLAAKCKDFLIKYRPKKADEDALNVVSQRNYFRLDRKFNVMTEGDPDVTFNEDTVIYHFCGVKVWDPWYQWRFSNFAKTFRSYAKMFEPDVTCWLTFKKEKDALINYSKLEPRFSYKMLSKKMRRMGFKKGALFFNLAHVVAKVRQKGIIGTLLMRSNTRT